MLTRVIDKNRKQPLYNVSPYTFGKLLGDSENIAPNLVAYINGFSETARKIFEKFKFGEQIEKLDASNRLFNIVKAMSEVDLHPNTISNLEMGYVFEHLVMKFNEQANEEAGDHFTPREVIRLMTHLIYTGEEDVYKAGVYREIYDPACGTGGMLSVSEETIRAGNKGALLGLYGQEYNDEAWAICCSDIRRWIIENDWLDAIVALPDQLFYNTGIFTYVWLVTNRKAPERRGKVQLIDGTRFFGKMKKSLNNKRNELSEEHIRRLTEIYGNFRDGEKERVQIDGVEEERVVSRIFENREFGFLKVTVERPLRLNFEATAERIARLDEQSAFEGLAVSKKRKDAKAAAAEEEAGRKEQEAIRALLATLAPKGRYTNRDAFEADLDAAAKRKSMKLPSPIKKAIFAALGERDPKADICTDGKGRPEPDSELRDTENLPLPPGTKLPLLMPFGPDAPNDELVKAMKGAIDAYIRAEVLPHVPDAWVDYAKTKVGYETPINRHFYVYKPPRPLPLIEADIDKLESEIARLLKGLVG